MAQIRWIFLFFDFCRRLATLPAIFRFHCQKVYISSQIIRSPEKEFQNRIHFFFYNLHLCTKRHVLSFSPMQTTPPSVQAAERPGPVLRPGSSSDRAVRRESYTHQPHQTAVRRQSRQHRVLPRAVSGAGGWTCRTSGRTALGGDMVLTG